MGNKYSIRDIWLMLSLECNGAILADISLYHINCGCMKIQHLKLLQATRLSAQMVTLLHLYYTCATCLSNFDNSQMFLVFHSGLKNANVLCIPFLQICLRDVHIVTELTETSDARCLNGE